MIPPSTDDPHAGQPVLSAGPELSAARTAVVLIHGRGGDARSILQLAPKFGVPGTAILAPQAAGSSWYPQRFLAAATDNEPELGSALRVVSGLVDRAAAAGIPRNRVLLGGFSQGACLALETALRLGGRFGGVFALSGAVIGEPEAVRPHDRRLDGTPAYLACGDIDAHIPVASVRESTRVLRAQGAVVIERIFPGLGHIIVTEETDHVRTMIKNAGL